MYNRQKGIPMLAVSVSGLFITLFSFALLCGWCVEIIGNFRYSRALLSDTIPYAIIWIFPYFIGRLLLGLFPSVQILSVGIKINKGLGFTKIIKWNEIENMVEYKGGIIALVINSKGSPVFNGLYFNKLYGYFVNADKPVVLLGPDMENRQEVLDRIVVNSKPNLIKKYI